MPIQIPDALMLPNTPLNLKYIRQIQLNEENIDLRYIYFNVLMIDGQTPALDETGMQPEINITSSGWSSSDIGLLEDLGFGRYRALLSNEAVNQLGVIVSRYIGNNTFECFGESIEIIQNYRQTLIFEDSQIPVILSYCNINEAENYFSMRLHAESWIDASGKDKLKSLTTATDDIERLAFKGWKTDPIQILEFPRNGSLSIPSDIKKAQCEIAFEYLDGYDPHSEIETLGIAHESYLSVRTTYDGKVTDFAKRSGIASEKAWRLLRPYLRDPYTIKMIRNS